MNRVDILLPPRIAFSIDFPLRVADLNYGGHLGNDRVLTLAQEVRVAWLATHGLGELDVGGVGLIMTDAAVHFGGEGRYGMVVRGDLAVGEVRTRAFELVHRFTDVGSGLELARAVTRLCCFDYEARRLVSLPEPLRRALEAAAGAAP